MIPKNSGLYIHRKARTLRTVTLRKNCLNKSYFHYRRLKFFWCFSKWLISLLSGFDCGFVWIWLFGYDLYFFGLYVGFVLVGVDGPIFWFVWIWLSWFWFSFGTVPVHVSVLLAYSDWYLYFQCVYQRFSILLVMI